MIYMSDLHPFVQREALKHGISWGVPSPPKAVGFSTRLPQLDGPVLAAGAVQLAVRREADGPDRAVVAFLHFYSPR